MKKCKTILVVDDEPDVLEFLSYNFRKNNFRVLVASSGKEGLLKTMTEELDLIISDIMMPAMNGAEMCMLIKSDTKNKNTPFIFLTAVNDDYKVLDAMTSGADQIASKPVRFEYVLAMVSKMLK
jgi:two-component system alkaline phosphatase synthesis response regulator PhoP